MNILNYLQSAIAFACGIGALFTVYSVLNKILMNKLQLQKPNEAYAVLKLGAILGTSLLVSSIIGPGINAVRFINQTETNIVNLLLSAGFMVIFVAIGVIFSFLVVAGGIFTLFQLTHINEWEEIQNNSIPTALISAGLIIGLSLIMKDPVATLCESLIPYPELFKVN
jgi:uncharacterized membrane protein YjfL (UPF0719 family)